jgi:hypothetical protein
MSTELVEFQNHTTAVGNKSSSIIPIGSQNNSGGIAAPLVCWAIFVAD